MSATVTAVRLSPPVPRRRAPGSFHLYPDVVPYSGQRVEWLAPDGGREAGVHLGGRWVLADSEDAVGYVPLYWAPLDPVGF